MRHEHSKHGCCEHCLHYCPRCDGVYCCKCQREWGKGLSLYWNPHPTPYWTYTIPLTNSQYVTIYDGDAGTTKSAIFGSDPTNFVQYIHAKCHTHATPVETTTAP